MSLDLLGGPAAALTTDKKSGHAQDASPGLQPGDASALFASLLAAVAAPVMPPGEAAATPAHLGESTAAAMPAALDTASGKANGNPVVVLPGLRLPIMLQEIPVEGGAAAQPQAGEAMASGAGLGEALSLAVKAGASAVPQLLMPRGQQLARHSAPTNATPTKVPAEADGAEVATAARPQAVVRVAGSEARIAALARTVAAPEATLTPQEARAGTTRAAAPAPALASATPSAAISSQQPPLRVAAAVVDGLHLSEVKPASESAKAPATAQTPATAQASATAQPAATDPAIAPELPATLEANTDSAPATPAASPAEAPTVAPEALTAVALDRLQAAARGVVARPLADTAGGPSVDPTRIQAQVTRALLANGGPRGGDQTLTLQLEPEHLGKVEVRLIARGGRLEVTFTAETAEAQVALRESTGDLVRTLSNRIDGRWQHIDVKVADPADPRRDSTQQDRNEQDRSRDGRRDPDQQERRRERRQNQ
jgi:flagellar hook-length control protein FliK